MVHWRQKLYFNQLEAQLPILYTIEGGQPQLSKYSSAKLTKDPFSGTCEQMTNQLRHMVLGWNDGVSREEEHNFLPEGRLCVTSLKACERKSSWNRGCGLKLPCETQLHQPKNYEGDPDCRRNKARFPSGDQNLAMISWVEV